MTGENGSPETPDWHAESRPCVVLDFLAARMSRDVEIPPNIVLADN